MITLRPYQSDVVERVERALEAGEKPIIVAPTGSGKTVIFCELIRRAVAKHKTVLVLAHRREIIDQTSRKLTAHGVRHGIIQSGRDNDLRPMEPVQVAAIATLWVRAVRTSKMPLPPADLIIIDESHHAVARTYAKLVGAYPNAAVLGVTATPCRGDGRGLGGIFTTLIEAPQVADLIVGGFLVRSLCYAPVDPDLKGVATVKGDYHEGQLNERMDREKLVGDIVTHWLKYGQSRRTIAFACSVGHSIHIRDEFEKAGIRAEHLDGNTSITDREAILGRLASGETQVVTNCMVLTEGFDCCPIGAIILARPTKKMGLFRQMIGRGLRPAEAKTDCVILDHSGAVYRHGLPEDHVAWTLATDKKASAPAHTARQAAHETKLVECSQCQTLRKGGLPCPNCGFLPRRPAEYIRHREGDLGLVDGGRARADKMTPAQQLQFYRELRGFAHARNMKGADGWAFYKCKEKGFKPPWAWKENYSPLPPSPAVGAWARSRLIAFAKARRPA
jgi:DNA repair protein RadD